MNTKVITSEYTDIFDDKAYIDKIASWYNSSYRIIRIKNSFGNSTERESETIYNEQDQKIANLRIVYNLADYIPVSENSYAYLREIGNVICWSYDEKLLYERALFEERANETIKVDVFRIVNGVMEVTYTITRANQNKETITLRLNPATGRSL